VLVAPGTSHLSLALDLSDRPVGGDKESPTILFVEVGDFATEDDALADLCGTLIKNPR